MYIYRFIFHLVLKEVKCSLHLIVSALEYDQENIPNTWKVNSVNLLVRKLL